MYAVGSLIAVVAAAVIIGSFLFGVGIALFAVALLVWLFLASQEVSVGGGRLAVRDGVGRLAWTRSFEAAKISDLRLEPAPHPFQEPIRFEYEGRTHGFAAQLDEDEARQLLARIRETLR
jgi:hypothetical protein